MCRTDFLPVGGEGDAEVLGRGYEGRGLEYVCEGNSDVFDGTVNISELVSIDRTGPCHSKTDIVLVHLICVVQANRGYSFLRLAPLRFQVFLCPIHVLKATAPTSLLRIDLLVTQPTNKKQKQAIFIIAGHLPF